MRQNPSLKLWPAVVIVLAVALMGGFTVSIPEMRTSMEGEHAAETSIVGADFSSLLQLEAQGLEVRDGTVTAPLEHLLKVNGVNYSRIRLWVDPESGVSGLNSALKLARRSAASDMDILLNIHYSDSWADPQHQEIPAAWAHLGREELISTVHTYTENVVRAFAEQNTPISMVQIGNEVNNGMLWPWGEVHRDWGEYWPGFAELYRAGVEGARAAVPASPPRIMVHISMDMNPGGVSFFENMLEHRMPFDVIGLTYYPFWNGSLNDLGQYMDYLADRFEKDIIIVETAYPWTMGDPPECPNIIGNSSNLPDRWIYPPTREGQAAFFHALRDTLNRVPDGRGIGYFVWEPAWLPSPGDTGVPCNEYAAVTLFDWEGTALPALHHLSG